MVATVVLLGEHLDWGLAGCTQGLRLAEKTRGLGARLADYPPYLDTIRGLGAELGQKYTLISLSFHFIVHKTCSQCMINIA